MSGSLKGPASDEGAPLRRVGGDHVVECDETSGGHTETAPLVSIVVATVVEYALTAACLRSLREQDYSPTEVILVFNGTPDDVIHQLREQFPECQTVILPRNRGFAGGYNAGLRRARGEYAAIINDDAVAAPSWIREMVAAARATDHVGIVGCSVTRADAPSVLDSQGLGIALDGMSRQVNRGVHVDSSPSHRETVLPSGCACMFSRDALSDVGLFDETFFAYCEDTDLAMRMLWSGYRLVLAPEAVVMHHYSTTSGKHSARKVFWVERNHFWVALKSFPLPLLVGVPAFTLWRYALQARALRQRDGELQEHARSVGVVRLVASVVAAHVSCLAGVPHCIAERRRIVGSRRVSSSAMTQRIMRSRMSLGEILAEERSPLGATALHEEDPVAEASPRGSSDSERNAPQGPQPARQPPAGALARERVDDAAWLPPWVRYEHQARYVFAGAYISGKDVVECACGTGASTQALLAGGPRSMACFDVDSTAIAKAAANVADKRVRFDAADGTRLPLADGSADVYVALETIEHVPDAQGFVREACRVLRPGGVFICSTPNRLMTNPGAGLTARPNNPFHVREYSVDELSSMLSTEFTELLVFGQSRVGTRMATALTWVGTRVSTHAAIRMGQAVKLPRLLNSPPERHGVTPWAPQWDYEYMVIVCKRP